MSTKRLTKEQLSDLLQQITVERGWVTAGTDLYTPTSMVKIPRNLNDTKIAVEQAWLIVSLLFGPDADLREYFPNKPSLSQGLRENPASVSAQFDDEFWYIPLDRYVGGRYPVKERDYYNEDEMIDDTPEWTGNIDKLNSYLAQQKEYISANEQSAFDFFQKYLKDYNFHYEQYKAMMQSNPSTRYTNPIIQNNRLVNNEEDRLTLPAYFEITYETKFDKKTKETRVIRQEDFSRNSGDNNQLIGAQFTDSNGRKNVIVLDLKNGVFAPTPETPTSQGNINGERRIDAGENDDTLQIKKQYEGMSISATQNDVDGGYNITIRDANGEELTIKSIEHLQIAGNSYDLDRISDVSNCELKACHRSRAR